MKKRFSTKETSIEYDPGNDASLCEPEAVMYPSNFKFASLDNIRRTFELPSHPMLVPALSDIELTYPI